MTEHVAELMSLAEAEELNPLIRLRDSPRAESILASSGSSREAASQSSRLSNSWTKLLTKVFSTYYQCILEYQYAHLKPYSQVLRIRDLNWDFEITPA